MALVGIKAQRLPYEGIDEGFKSINDILDKARQASLERGKFQEMQRHNGADIGLRREAGARAGASAARESALQPLRLDLLKQKLASEKRRNDPNAKMKELETMLNFFSGGQPAEQSMEESSGNPAMAAQPEQNPMEQDQMAQGQGPMESAPMEEEEEEEQTGDLIPPEMKGFMQDPRMQQIAKDPLKKAVVGGWMKKNYGVNPFEAPKETPAEKRINDLKSEIEGEEKRQILKKAKLLKKIFLQSWNQSKAFKIY